MTQTKKEQTISSFQEIKVAADKYRSKRNNRLLANHRKDFRNFTRAEASKYLGVDVKTLDKYAKQIGFDPRRHEDSVWSLDIQEIYELRDSLPAEKRKEPKFIRSEKQKCQIINIQNQKGGVSKTVSSATIASCLASEFHQEFRVGLVDMDGQGTLSMYYATEAHELGSLSVGDLIRGNYELDEGETFQEAVSSSFLPTTIPNLRILPASQSDRALEGWFHEQIFKSNIKEPYTLLANILKEVEDEFDIIIIDTPPSLGYATYNSYYAGTSVIFPITASENDVDASCSYFSYIPQVYDLLSNAGHPGYDLMKILLTNHKESSTATEILTQLSELLSKYIYSKEFRHSEAVRQSSALLSTVFDMSKSEYPKSKASFQLAQLNAYEVTSQIYRDIAEVWRKQEEN